MKKTSIIIGLLLLIIIFSITGYFFLFHKTADQNYYELDQKFALELSSKTEEYFIKMKKNINDSSIQFKDFSNQYFNFEYPEDWTLENNTDEVILKSPIITMEDKSEVNPIIIDFTVYNAQEFIDQFYGTEFPYLKSDLDKLNIALRTDNVDEFANILYGPKSYLYSLVSLNGKIGVVRHVISDSDSLTSNTLSLMFLFLENEKIIRLSIHDLSRVPNVAINQRNLFNYNFIKEKPYSSIIESIHIN